MIYLVDFSYAVNYGPLVLILLSVIKVFIRTDDDRYFTDDVIRVIRIVMLSILYYLIYGLIYLENNYLHLIN